MSNIERKLKRNNKKKSTEKDLAIKVALMGRLPDKCLTCENPFDKTNKEQVNSWNVVIKEQKDIVRLYCPECWQKAIEIIQDFKEHVTARKDK